MNLNYRSCRTSIPRKRRGKHTHSGKFAVEHSEAKCLFCMYIYFNYDRSRSEDRYTSKFIEAMFDQCFYLLINKPTRITSSSATVLDHVWTNVYSHVIKAKILFHIISDHMPLLTCFETYQHKSIHNCKIRIFNS